MRGLVKIEVIRRLKGKKESKVQQGHNMISNGGLAGVMGEAMRGLLGASQCPGGSFRTRTSMWGDFVQYSPLWSNKYFQKKIARKDMGLSCALLGINDNAYLTLDSRRGFLPLLASTGKVDTDAVRALANIGAVAGTDVGVSEKMNDASIIDVARVGNKYDFPGGTGTGNVTGVAMIPASWKPGQVPYGGLLSFKRMDDFYAFTDRITGATKAVAPGLDGLGLEVRMQYTTEDGVVSHVRNLSTGAMTDGSASDWYPDTGYEAFFDDGTYIYAGLKRTSSSSIRPKIRRYLKTDKTSYNDYDMPLATDQMSNPTYVYEAFYGCYILNGVTHMWVAGYDYQNQTNIAFVRTAQGNVWMTFTDKQTLADWLFANYTITMPSDWVTDSTIFGILPSTLGTYTAFHVLKSYDSAPSSNTRFFRDVYIFSDGANVISSMVDMIPMLANNDIVWTAGGKIGVMEIGYQFVADAEKLIGNSSSSQNVEGYVSGSFSIKDAFYAGESNYPFILDNGTEYYGEGFSNVGCWIAMNGMWSTWLSVKQLEEDVNKSESTDIKVEYDYAFEGSGTTPVSNS